MIGTKEICALLLAGSMGAGSVVGVQHVAPSTRPATKSQPRPKITRKPARKAAPKQTTQTPRTQPPAGPAIIDCPLPGEGAGAFDLGDLWAPTGFDGAGDHDQGRQYHMGGHSPLQPDFPMWHGGGGGVVSPPPPPITPDGNGTPPAAPVPEPAAWAMLITGFGIAGMAARRERKLA